MKRLLPLLAFVAVLLTGCPDPREVVNFDTDPRILRGSWNFVLSDPSSNTVVSTQAVVFTPTFISEGSYSVTASVTLEGEVYALAGDVYAQDRKFVRLQNQPAPSAFFTLTGRATPKTYTAQLDGQVFYLGRERFYGRLQTGDSVANTKSWNLEIIRNR